MKNHRTISVAANVLMAAVFAFAAAVQYNDPDGLAWMALYGTAAICSILFITGHLTWWVPAVIGGIALVWAGFIAPDVIGRIPWSSIFARFEMESSAVENAREMGGLLIVTVWTAGLAAVSYRTPTSERA